jgi:ATP-dependent DNA helicase RecQ
LVTCVPSHRHPELVPFLAKRVADLLGIPFVEAVNKVRINAPQKEMNNAYYQAKNLDGVFEVSKRVDGHVLLIDDVIDSGWTVTVISALLRREGAQHVYPVALATTGKM